MKIRKITIKTSEICWRNDSTTKDDCINTLVTLRVCLLTRLLCRHYKVNNVLILVITWSYLTLRGNKSVVLLPKWVTHASERLLQHAYGGSISSRHNGLKRFEAGFVRGTFNHSRLTFIYTYFLTNVSCLLYRQLISCLMHRQGRIKCSVRKSRQLVVTDVAKPMSGSLTVAARTQEFLWPRCLLPSRRSPCLALPLGLFKGQDRLAVPSTIVWYFSYAYWK